MTETPGIRDHFRRQAQSCARMGSPFTARLCNLMADRLGPETRSGDRLLNWCCDTHGPDAVALRLMGALHATVLKGRDAGLMSIYPPTGSAPTNDDDLWKIVENALHTHDGFIHDWLDSPPQTNEVARAAMILPALMSLSEQFNRPLALYEIGASAGLTLQLTQFGYDYGGKLFGEAASPVQLAPEVKSAPPLGGSLPSVVSRRGCDLNPLDTRDPANAIRLCSYIWPDQPERHARVTGAMALYANDPPNIEQADAADWMTRELAARPADAISVFYHTIVWQYLPDHIKTHIETALEHAGRDATPGSPLVFIGMEGYANPGYAVLEQTLWAGGAETDGVKTELAHVDYHGRWIEWRS
jgi:hypothetical protein